MYDFTLQKIKDGWPYENVPDGFSIPEVISNKSIFVSPFMRNECERAYNQEQGVLGKDCCGFWNSWFFGFVDANLE